MVKSFKSQHKITFELQDTKIKLLNPKLSKKNI